MSLSRVTHKVVSNCRVGEGELCSSTVPTTLPTYQSLSGKAVYSRVNANLGTGRHLLLRRQQPRGSPNHPGSQVLFCCGSAGSSLQEGLILAMVWGSLITTFALTMVPSDAVCHPHRRPKVKMLLHPGLELADT